MKNQILAVAAILGVISSFVWNLTHKPPKIGYVETSILMQEFSESIKAKREFEVLQKDWDKNLARLNDSLLSALDGMKKEFDQAKTIRKQELRSDFEKRQDDYQRYIEAVKKMSQEKERELMDPVVKKANGFLDLWGKQHGFDFILGTTNGGNIVQANPNLNLTSIIIKDLNEQYRELPMTSEKPNPGVGSKDSNAAVHPK